MNITIAVGGRFHADRVANSLQKYGHDVELFTTYPRKYFPGLPPPRVQSQLGPEIVFRVAQWWGYGDWGDQYKMKRFARRVAHRMNPTADALFCWSSFGQEALEASSARRKILVRESTHILHQMEVLQEEHQTLGIPLPQREICTERELREYELVDRIAVLSQYARQTFLVRGFNPKKVKVLPLSVDTQMFFPPPARDWSGRLQVVYAGSLSVRKGIHYLLEASETLKNWEVDLHLAGTIAPEILPWIPKFPHLRFHPSLSWADLAQLFRRSHLFLFPTLEDGFGAVVPQAMASGLVPLVTSECGASDWVTPENGFIMPARSATGIIAAVEQALNSRPNLEEKSRQAILTARERNWNFFDQTVRQLLEEPYEKI